MNTSSSHRLFILFSISINLTEGVLEALLLKVVRGKPVLHQILSCILSVPLR